MEIDDERWLEDKSWKSWVKEYCDKTNQIPTWNPATELPGRLPSLFRCTVTITIDNKPVTAEGTACSKKEAEHQAARKMLMESMSRDMRQIINPTASCQAQTTVAENDGDPISTIKMFCDHKRIDQPVYKDIDVVGPSHDRIFTMACEIQSLDIVVTAKGKNKKEAKKKAAAQALTVLRDSGHFGESKTITSQNSLSTSGVTHDKVLEPKEEFASVKSEVAPDKITQDLVGFEKLETLPNKTTWKVFKAKRLFDGRTYIVKRHAISGEPHTKDRLWQEVSALAQLNHPNILRYYNAWFEKSTVKKTVNHFQRANITLDMTYLDAEPEMETVFYIQQKFCENTLKNWLHCNQRREMSVVFVLLSDIASAIAYLHSKGIVHGRLKPSNIFLLESKALNTAVLKVKVGDFRLANILDESIDTDASTYACSGEKKKCDQQKDSSMIDIYAMGVLFYEILVPLNPEKRTEALRDLRLHKFPEEYFETYKDKFGLIKQMISDEPSNRPTALDVQAYLNDKITHANHSTIKRRV